MDNNFLYIWFPSAFVVYFLLSILINKFIGKKKFDIKRTVIDALLGLLIYLLVYISHG